MIARWAIAGFILWFVIALAFRFFGQEVFRTGEGGVTTVFIVAPLAIGALTYALLRLLRVASSDRAEAASVFAVTGLIVGIFEIRGYATLFPNLPASLNDEFAALMFACFAAVAFVGLVSSRVESI
jgi:hypothetical protein